jgi:hypothetical protein
MLMNKTYHNKYGFHAVGLMFAEVSATSLVVILSIAPRTLSYWIVANLMLVTLFVVSTYVNRLFRQIPTMLGYSDYVKKQALQQTRNVAKSMPKTTTHAKMHRVVFSR